MQIHTWTPTYKLTHSMAIYFTWSICLISDNGYSNVWCPMSNILLTPHSSCHRIKYFCLFRQVWFNITPDLFLFLLLVIDEQHWRIQCIRKTCTHFSLCCVLFCCVVVSVDLISPTSVALSCGMAVQLPVKEAQCYEWKDHMRALDTHDIAMADNPQSNLMM